MSKTEQELLLEMEALQTRLDAAERRLQEGDELLQAQIAERKRAGEAFEIAQEYTKGIVETIREPLLVLACGPESNHSQSVLLRDVPCDTWRDRGAICLQHRRPFVGYSCIFSLFRVEIF